MSQFLDTPNYLVTSENICEFLTKYVCQEFHPFIKEPEFETLTENSGEKVIQEVLEKSNHKLRMYGSAQELTENLKIFRNHPDSWRSTTMFAPFHAPVVVYKSLNNEPYILKTDLLAILQNMALKKFQGSEYGSGSPPENLITSLGMSLKFETWEIPNGRVEFVKFNLHKVFAEIEKELEQGFKKAKELGEENVLRDLEKEDLSSFTAKLNDIDSRVYEENDKRHMIQNMLHAVKEDRLARSIDVSISSICANYVEYAISRRPEVFKSSQFLPTVRVFEDGDERFVMCMEIHDVVDRDSAEVRSGSVFETCSMHQVEERYGEKKDSIQFIRTPILRAKHRAVPIPMGYGFFAILAVDMLFEFFRNLIFGEKAFQKQTSEFLQALEDPDSVLDSETKNVFFLSTDMAKHFDVAAKTALKSVEKIPTKDVRNAKKDGFTVQNLKNELAHLNLTKAFPEIQNHADVVYSEVDKRKKEQVLRTCDLFDAIEHCQLICILHRLPRIRKFVHNQKGCHRVYGYKCEHCEKEEKPSESSKVKEKEQKTSEVQESSRIKDLEKELAQMKQHLDKTLQENRKLREHSQCSKCNGDLPKI